MLVIGSGCAGFDTPRLDVPFVILDTNAAINSFTSEYDDLVWGQEDYWATPKEFYSKGAGDCEDHVIAKYFALRKAGISADKMYLVVGEIDDGDTVHMVLHVKYKEIFVLDNIVKKVTPLNEYLDMKVLYKFNETGVYFAGLSDKAPIGYLPKWKNLIGRMKGGA